MVTLTTYINDTNQHNISNKHIPIRYIKFSVLSNEVISVHYEDSEIGYFNQNKDLIIKFESYNGYPDLSKFKINQYNLVDNFINVIADTAPEMPISSSYFERLDS